MENLFGNLFETEKRQTKPLADRMRPERLSDFVGQENAVGSGSPLRRMIERDVLQSVLFYGPPGTGKTTLAKVIAHVTGEKFEAINAVSSGVPELRKLIAKAQEDRRNGRGRTIVFIDEIHRFNKAQQDVLLPYVENGTIVLIGATTENPFFEINSPLLSRMKVELDPRTMVRELDASYKQIIEIARALLMQATIIIMDEPTTALDVTIQAQVMDMIADLQKKLNTAMILITHDLGIVAEACDQVAVIYAGEIVELASKEELFLHPLHPYTKALLSAVPIPDPSLEKHKKLLVYDPSIHDYSVDKPVWEEIANGHFVYGNQKELEGYRKEYQSQL